MLSAPLKQKDIFGFFSRSAMHKAGSYHAQGRVSGLEASADLTHIRARVAGQASYAVDIALTYRGDRLAELDGDCTCPVSHNCKHVAATMLEILSRANGPTKVGYSPKQETGNPGGGTGAAVPRISPVLPAEIITWLENIGNAIRGDDYPAELTQRLLYCLRPLSQGAQMPHLGVSVISARQLKGGGFAANFSRPNPSDFAQNRAPKYFRDSDIDILGHPSFRAYVNYAYSDGYRIQSAKLLQQIVTTGRAFWLNHNGTPLRWGAVREGRIEWHQASKAGVSPMLTVAGATALNAEPPVYVDEATGLTGAVEPGLPARAAHQLLSAPPIPGPQVAEVARRIGQKLPEIPHDLLPAPPVAAIRIAEDPIPVLRLVRGQVSIHGYFYRLPEQASEEASLAHLSFRYGPVEIDLSERAREVESFKDGQIYMVSRRRTKERSALQRLTDFDFIEARFVYPFLDARHSRDLTLREPRDWLDFLNRHARELQAQGFEILIDDDFPYRLAVSSDGFDAEFESSGIDWFELSLGIEVDGERHDFAALLAAMISTPDFTPDAVKALAENGDDFYLPLSDGRYVALAADRFLPLMLALHSLNLSGGFADRSGKIKLSRAEIVPLLGLENEKFAFKGADNIRRLAGLLHARGLADVSLPAGFKATLRPYQAQGVAWLDLLRESGLGGVLADDMGLGKTVQLLALLALEKSRGSMADPALVIAPTSLMTNWLNEAHKFVPELKVLVLHGNGRKDKFVTIPDHDVVLTTYPLIARDHEVLLSRQWHMAILDEAQNIKNPNAATTRWLREIKSGHRFCMTGTPMENHLGELWSIMSFVNPGFLGDKTSFVRQWRTPIEKRGDTVRAAALAHRVKPFLLRRAKTEVATELPPKSEIIERIVLESSQRDLYDSVRLSMSAKVRQAIRERGLQKSHILILEALLRLRQACCDPRLLKLGDGVERPSAKLDRLLEMVLELSSENRKIIVFSQFTSMLELIRTRIEEEHIKYELLTGETRDRKSAIDNFQSGKSDVFLISLKAGGVGLNLTAADTVILFDAWWNPAVEEQAIDRAYRIGQDKAVFVYRLVAADTIEEKMDELKARKRALADGLFDRKGRVSSALTEADVEALFEL